MSAFEMLFACVNYAAADLILLFDPTEIFQRPNAKDNLADDLFLCDAAHLTHTRVDRACALIPHHEELPVRHLERQFRSQGPKPFSVT